MSRTHTVAVVVDRDFADRLCDLSNRTHVWIAATPENRAAAERIWKSRTSLGEPFMLTTFQFRPEATPDQVVADELESIELHHGSDSPTNPWSALEVIGAQLTPQLEAELRDIGFVSFDPTADGFTCARTAA